MERRGATAGEADASPIVERTRRVLVDGQDRLARATAAEQLRAAGLFEVVDRDGLADNSDPSTTIPGFWGILSLAGSGPYTRSALASNPQLRALSVVEASPDDIDLAAATELGIAVCVAPGRATDAVADHTLALILACLRQVLHTDAVVRTGKWRPDRLARDLHRATVGIVGFSPIADAVIERLMAFDCRVLVAELETEPVLERLLPHGRELERLPLHALLPQVDVLTLHLEAPLTDQPLIGAAELAALRPDAVVVNIADPRLVDDRALAEALVAGRLGAAGLDALSAEPLGPDHHLLHAPNTVLTGRIAALTDGVARSRIEESVANLVALTSQRRPRGCVNPEAIDMELSDGE